MRSKSSLDRQRRSSHASFQIHGPCLAQKTRGLCPFHLVGTGLLPIPLLWGRALFRATADALVEDNAAATRKRNQKDRHTAHCRNTAGRWKKRMAGRSLKYRSRSFVEPRRRPCLSQVLQQLSAQIEMFCRSFQQMTPKSLPRQNPTRWESLGGRTNGRRAVWRDRSATDTVRC
ncbi:MAG: hypothetical protein BWY57_02708 [Betaproteobacteria bacterium ADurb.Bin341]|nr:MAG: hypothetical protein BWY57_02708 [Betaproteobacteria bacterium ADurb.Bin341]